MPTVDYDQVARFEAASELLSTLMGVCISLEDNEPTYATRLEDKRCELMKIKQALRVKDDDMVKKVRDTYGPLARSYYDNPKDFKLTESFFNTRVTYENRS